jgi:hypothetical protein
MEVKRRFIRREFNYKRRTTEHHFFPPGSCLSSCPNAARRKASMHLGYIAVKILRTANALLRVIVAGSTQAMGYATHPPTGAYPSRFYNLWLKISPSLAWSWCGLSNICEPDVCGRFWFESRYKSCCRHVLSSVIFVFDKKLHANCLSRGYSSTTFSCHISGVRRALRWSIPIK